jgi:hypothetical protein
VGAGGSHGLGLKADGSIVAWGDNYYGQCNVPTPNNDFVAVSAGDVHSLGLKQDGSIVAWGYNNYGDCNVPSPNTGFVAVAAAWYNSLGLKADGSIVVWGFNYYGQCNVPLPNIDYVDVAAGFGYSLGLKNDGSIVTWGRNVEGQCDVPSPNTGFVDVEAMERHNLGLKQDGSIVAWGDNGRGQCNIPSPNTHFVAITSGVDHSLGLKQDGTIVAWGGNGDGQCNIPSPNSGFVAVTAGAWKSFAIRANRAPIACIEGGDQIVEAESDCEARVVLDGSCSSDEDSTEGTNDDIVSFEWYEQIDPCDANSDILLGSGEVIECNLPLGEHNIILEVTDEAGESDSNEITVTVEDVMPPVFSLTVTPTVLWPANHKMVRITPVWETSDNCDDDVEVSLVDITVEDACYGEAQRSRESYHGDDIQTGDDGSIYLRAERSGKGNGRIYPPRRIYTVTYQAVDDSNNVTLASATVTVPHDRR